MNILLKICCMPLPPWISFIYTSTKVTVFAAPCVTIYSTSLEAPVEKCGIMWILQTYVLMIPLDCTLTSIFILLRTCVNCWKIYWFQWNVLTRSFRMEHPCVNNNKTILAATCVNCGSICWLPGLFIMLSKTIFVPSHHMFQVSYIFNWLPTSFTMVSIYILVPYYLIAY